MRPPEIPTLNIDLQDCAGHSHKTFAIRPLNELLAQDTFIHFPHRHDFYNLLYFTQGEGTHTVDFTEYTVQPGRLFFMQPGQIHAWKLSGDVQGYTLFFTIELFYQCESVFELNQLPLFQPEVSTPYLDVPPEERELYAAHFQALLHEHRANQPYRDLWLQGRLKQLLVEMSRCIPHSRPQGEPSSAQQLVRKFQLLIERDYAAQRSVTHYANELCITPKHLNNVCKELAGKTAGMLIRERVILEAKRLLRHTARSVSEIAYQLSFADPPYFSRFFKKYTGMTPEQYRRETTEGVGA